MDKIYPIILSSMIPHHIVITTIVVDVQLLLTSADFQPTSNACIMYYASLQDHN